MERLIIVVDCPDSWRDDDDGIDPQVVARRIKSYFGGPDLAPIGVRVRWQSLDADSHVGALPGKAEQ